MLTTSAIDSVALVEFAATSSVNPDAVASTVTLADGHAVVSLEVTAPDDIAVNRTGYGLVLVSVKYASPSTNPGYKSVVPVTAVTVTVTALSDEARPEPEPFADHTAHATPAAATAPTATQATASFLLNLIMILFRIR